MGAQRNPDLEAAIRANRDDPAPYLVYADWLQQHGNPYGELIVLSHDDATHPTDAKHERLHHLIEAQRFPDETLATATWRHGMWSTLRFGGRGDPREPAFDPVAAARPLFAHLACAALEELTIGVLRWDDNHLDVPAVIAAAGAHAWAGDLVSLHLDADVDMAQHGIGDVGAVVSRAFPRLRELILHAAEQSDIEGETFGVAGLDLPSLERLVVETCSLSRARVEALMAGHLPMVHDLELWFGSPDSGADATYTDLAPLLGRRAFPHVTHLGLRNAMFTDEVAVRLGGTSLAPRLEALDLSMGTLDDDSALVLAQSAHRFARLQSVNVDDNFLTEVGLAALSDAFPEVLSEHQKPFDPDAPNRYVTIG